MNISRCSISKNYFPSQNPAKQPWRRWSFRGTQWRRNVEPLESSRWHCETGSSPELGRSANPRSKSIKSTPSNTTHLSRATVRGREFSLISKDPKTTLDRKHKISAIAMLFQNAPSSGAGLTAPMTPNSVDNRPYSILPGGNFHSSAKSASDVHYVNRPFTKPPCASLSTRKNATFCVKDDQYPRFAHIPPDDPRENLPNGGVSPKSVTPNKFYQNVLKNFRDSVVQSAFIDPLTARRLVPYIPDEELVSAEANDVKTQNTLSEACTSEVRSEIGELSSKVTYGKN